MEPLRLFWGLLNIPAWGYRQVMTIAQVELLSCDTPIVVYGRDKEKYSKKEVDEMVAKWKKKREEDKAKGKKFSLNGFIRTGKLEKSKGS